MNAEDLERLELKIAYLERANQELSDVVFRQQQELRALSEQIIALVGRVEGLGGDEMRVATEEPRPQF